MKHITLLFLLIFSITTVGAQDHVLISGKVIDVVGKNISRASIKIIETNQFAISNEKGEFKLNAKKHEKAILHIEISYIGYQKLSRIIQPISNINLGTLVLKELNLSLEGIEINAKSNFEGSSNSSLMISRDIIEQIPALSLSDLLNQIPNKKTVAPSLQNVQGLTLRSAFSPVNTGRNVYEMSNAFGVAIIVDGNTINNNLNMQSYNPGIYGSSASGSSINISSYGLNGTPTGTYSGDFAYGGIDLRQIPANQIESIEVIAGVPSAKYGDLSDGAVLVERQAGKSPAQISMQLRDNATSYGFSQGFGLGEKAGNLNVGLNYVNSFADNRDKLKAYNRLNLSTMYTNYFGVQKELKNTISLDYGRNLDGVKRDTDDQNAKMVKFNSWNFSVANRTFYNVNHQFLKNISLNLKLSNGHQVSYTEQLVNNPYILVSDATSTGIHEGSYAAGIYNAQSLIDGRPLGLSAKLDFNSEFNALGINHFLGYGLSYSYGANNGLGQVLDPSRPRTLTAMGGNSSGTNRSERYYDFSLAVPQNDIGFYVEDYFTTRIANRNLNVRAGMRYDIQNNLPSFSPRINVNYEWNKNLRFGLAYGIGYKSPALGQRYPGPTYFEFPVVNAYNGNVKESIYLVYVNRYDPSAKGLKPANSQTIEFSSQYKLKKYHFSFNAFYKNFRNGIGNTRVDQRVTLPTYSYTFREGEQPLLTQTGNKTILANYYKFDNNLASNNQGFDLIFSTPEYKAIATSFNISGGLFRTKNKAENLHYSTFDATNTRPDYALIGIYPANRSTSYSSNGRISSTTHLPKISLFIRFVAEFSLLQKTIQAPNAGIPIAYYTNDYRYITIANFDQKDPNYGHLYKPDSELNLDNIPKIIPNFHLSIGKEIKKRFKFSFNVHNVFNYQPYYINSSKNYIYPNQAPTFGAELSLKL